MTTERVLLHGDHPWAGHTATVISRDQVGGMKVRIDQLDHEAYAFAGQWKRVQSPTGGGRRERPEAVRGSSEPAGFEAPPPPVRAIDKAAADG